MEKWAPLLSSLLHLLEYDSEFVDQLLTTYNEEDSEVSEVEAEHGIVVETVLNLLTEQTCPWVGENMFECILHVSEALYNYICIFSLDTID